jgi:endonuclease III
MLIPIRNEAEPERVPLRSYLECGVVALTRLQKGGEEKNYNATYREEQGMIEAEIPAAFDARIRAYLLLKRHGQELCKRINPKCGVCPVQGACAFVKQ